MQEQLKSTNQIAKNTKRKIIRIGISLGRVPNLNTSALKLLILQMNCHQHSLEFEFLPTASRFKRKFLPSEYESLPTAAIDDFCNMLSSKKTIDRNQVRATAPKFLTYYKEFLERDRDEYKIKELLPDHIALITLARFSNNYYTLRIPGLSIIALGNWKRIMAPPSILEFILTLILREAVAVASPSSWRSIHLGTKGCLFDFTAYIEDARYKVLQGFICQYCRSLLDQDDLPFLADELVLILEKGWLGKPTDPNTPAGIVANLGYDLFLNKGLKPTAKENIRIWLQKDGVPEFLKLIGTIIAGVLLALALFILGVSGK